MYFRDLQEQYRREKVKQRINFFSYIWIGTVVVLRFFSHIFWCHLLLLTVVFGTILILLAFCVFKRKLYFKKPHILKSIALRLFAALLAGGIIFLVNETILKLYLDIPYYYKEDYKVISGKGYIKTSSHRGNINQTITVRGVSLHNEQDIVDRSYDGEMFRIYYLPHSKYIVKMAYWEF